MIFFYSNYGFPGRAMGGGIVKKIESVFIHWDVGHYEAIATFGYKKALQYAFFPLLPALIFVVSTLTKLSIDSSIVLVAFLNFALFYFALRWFWKSYYQSELDFVLVLSLPYTFFLLFPYTESLYLGLTFLFFTILHKKIKGWWLYLAILAFFLVLSRSVGAVLAPSLLVYLLIESYPVFKIHGWKLAFKNCLYYLPTFFTYLAGLGVYLYLGYLGTGNWLQFKESQKEWGRFSENNNLIAFSKDLFQGYLHFPSSENKAEKIMLVVGLFAIIFFFTKAKKTAFNVFISVYSLFVCILPLMSYNLASLHRLMIAVPVYYLVFVYWLASIKDPNVKGALQIGFFMFNFVLLLVFASGRSIWLG
jgi:hypothetical protein